MKLIEGMKKITELQRKAEDLRSKVKLHCAHQSVEKPVYESQQNQIDEWIQAHSDILKEILKLRVAIQKTNLATPVTIELGGVNVTKSIAEWIHRRRELAITECAMWESLTDRGLREGVITTSQNEKVPVSIVRYYNPAKRDKNIDIFKNEPSVIDRTLEVKNAVTDLIED
jgi:hypothetical protein